MDAKVSNWQEKSKKIRTSIMDELKEMQQESTRQHNEKMKTERINQFIQEVPYRFRGKTFDDYKIEDESQARVKNLAQRYVETFAERIRDGASVIFMGKPGTGKTLLSLIMYQELAKAGYSIKYESSLEFIKNLLGIKFKSQSDYQSHVEKYQNVQLLILDEVTESINKDGFLSEIERQTLFNIIDHRYKNALCTLIITNRNSEELLMRLGESTIDRLLEKSITLAFNWSSYRK